ncbi:MAG: SMC family ATPase, partial [Lachnospiraceae bacterium]
MKPVKLIMSAFGSYGGTEVIEFDKIQNGLFLIAGDTGAGKSTIFDAIMFALYDTMSGKERKSIMMRSEYASDNMETYVEYTFSYGSSIYTIKRFPAYVRKSKRRNKDGQYNIIRQQGKVELTMPDGTAYNGKIAQVNQKIEEITGLTAEQFNKIALIAQGEFQELVMDRTGKRKEIFRQIFSTQIYGDIEDIIFKRYKAEASQIKYNSTKLEELVKGIDFQEDSPYKEDFNIAFERKDTEPDRLPDIMRAETSRLKDIYNGKQNLYIEKETEYKKLNNYITKGKEKNKLIDRLLEFEKQKEKLSSLKEDIENKIIVLGLARKAEKVLFAEKNYNNRKEECTKASKKYEELKLKEEELNKQYNISLEKYHQADKEYRQLMPGYITKRDNLKQDVIKYKTVSEKENELLRLESLLKKVVSEKENEIKILAKIK